MGISKSAVISTFIASLLIITAGIYFVKFGQFSLSPLEALAAKIHGSDTEIASVAVVAESDVAAWVAPHHVVVKVFSNGDSNRGLTMRLMEAHFEALPPAERGLVLRSNTCRRMRGNTFFTFDEETAGGNITLAKYAFVDDDVSGSDNEESNRLDADKAVDFTLCEDVRDLPDPLGGRLAAALRQARVAAAYAEYRERVDAEEENDGDVVKFDIAKGVTSHILSEHFEAAELPPHTSAEAIEADISAPSTLATLSLIYERMHPADAESLFPCGWTRSYPSEPWQWCRVYTKSGSRVLDWKALQSIAASEENGVSPVHLYLIAPDRSFVHPHPFEGHVIQISGEHHAQLGVKTSVKLTSVSENPRVFTVDGFISANEAEALLSSVESLSAQPDKATLAGSGAAEPQPADGSLRITFTEQTAAKYARRLAGLLGLDDVYDDSMAGPMDVMRHNSTGGFSPRNAFVLRDADPLFAFDTARNESSSNRFAVLVLALSGGSPTGDVVIPDVQATTLHPTPDEKAAAVAKSHSGIVAGSWEAELRDICLEKLVPRTVPLQGILIYSVYPDGVLDGTAAWGLCPNLVSKSRWVATVEVWSGRAFAIGDAAAGKFATGGEHDPTAIEAEAGRLRRLLNAARLTRLLESGLMASGVDLDAINGEVSGGAEEHYGVSMSAIAAAGRGLPAPRGPLEVSVALEVGSLLEKEMTAHIDKKKRKEEESAAAAAKTAAVAAISAPAVSVPDAGTTNGIDNNNSTSPGMATTDAIDSEDVPMLKKLFEYISESEQSKVQEAAADAVDNTSSWNDATLGSILAEIGGTDAFSLTEEPAGVNDIWEFFPYKVRAKHVAEAGNVGEGDECGGNNVDGGCVVPPSSSGCGSHGTGSAEEKPDPRSVVWEFFPFPPEKDDTHGGVGGGCGVPDVGVEDEKVDPRSVTWKYFPFPPEPEEDDFPALPFHATTGESNAAVNATAAAALASPPLVATLPPR